MSAGSGLAADALLPATQRGWRAGYGNLLDKELRSWWRTRRWVIHLLLWPSIIGSVCLIMWFKQRGVWTGAQALPASTQLFFQFGGFFALIGAILAAQSAMVGERRSGTAAWVLTKPTTRKAFVISKFVGISFSFLTLSLVIPAIIWHAQMWLQWQTLPEIAHFLEAAGILALHQLFYIAFTLMLGTLFAHRGAVSGTALGFWFAGGVVPGMLPEWVTSIMPWALVQAAGNVALWRPVAITLWQPCLATAAWTALFLAVALWRFEREEF